MFTPHLKYREDYMTVVPTSMSHDHSSQAGAVLSTQASPAYVLLSQVTKTLICIYTMHECWQLKCMAVLHLLQKCIVIYIVLKDNM